MEKTLKVINELEAKGLIEKYAIGGAFAALFYMEPALTYDLDVFIFLPKAKSKIVVLTPIYDYLRKKGYREDKEHILIEGTPVQFIPAYNALTEEAVRNARETKYGKERTRVFRAEHLAAVMLQTNRPKDRARLGLFLEEAGIDRKKLKEIAKRNHLTETWAEISKNFFKRR